MSGTVMIDDRQFQIYPIKSALKKESGLYAFMKINQNNKWFIIYIGETDDMDARVGTGIQQHHSFNCAVKVNGATHIAVHYFSGSRDERLKIEKRLREIYDPPCNKQ